MRVLQYFKPLVLCFLFFLNTGLLFSQSQNALDFDGVDDHVPINYFARPNTFTLEFWIKDEGTTNGVILSWNRSSPAYPYSTSGVSLNNGELRYTEFYDGGFPVAYSSPNTTLTPGSWHHISIVRDNGARSIYMDGVFIGTGANTTNLPNVGNDNLTIGAEIYYVFGSTSTSGFFTGTLDDLRMWNYARTPAQIQNAMNQEMTGNEPGLLFSYNFNQGIPNGNNPTVTSLQDNSPNSNNGSLVDFALSGTTSNWVGGTATCVASYGIDTRTACGSYTWIDGNTYMSSTNTPTHTITGGASSGCDSIVTLNLTVFNTQEQTVSATDGTIYCPNSTTINVQGSEVGVDYFLFDNNQDTLVEGPTAGTGSPLSFTTGIINSTMAYGVEAKSGFTPGVGIGFNGGDEKIVVPADPAFDFTTGTLEAWIKPTANSNYGEMFLTMRSSDASTRYSFHVVTSSNLFGLWNGSTYTTLNYSINPGTWYHVAFRITATNTEVYVNGEYVGDLGVINTSIVGEAFVMGGSNDPLYPNERYIGEMDNVRVWNTLRTANEIKKNMDMCLTGDESGLVALYKLDDGTGSSIATDATGIHNGTLDASMDPGTDWVTGVDCYTCRLEMASTATVTFNQINTVGTDVQTACDSYTWIDGNTYMASNNTATHTVTNMYGCDSTVTLDLTITNSTTGTDVQTACDSYTWIDGNTYMASNNSATYTLTNALGCDSIVALDLTITNSTTGTDVQTACDSFTWIDGNTYMASNNTATHALTNALGCDSIVTLDLTITNSTTGTDVQTACDSFTWIDGNTYMASNNTATYTLTNALGCDSIVTLDLTITNSTTGTDVQTACDSYTWIDGNTYMASNNSAMHALTNALGCDSIVTLDLTITNSTTGTDVQTACDSYTWIDGNTYMTSNNNATHTLTNVAGCDSIVTLALTINTVNSSTTTSGLTITANESGATYQWIDCGNGNTPISGETNQSFTATANGDYAVIVTLNSCSDTSSCESISTVGLGNVFEHQSISVAPNPSKSYFLIEGDLLKSTNSIQVISIEGKQVIEQSVNDESSFEIDAINWTPGVYFLNLKTEYGDRTFKLIKE